MSKLKSKLLQLGMVPVAVASLAVPVGLVLTATPASATAACGSSGPNRDSTVYRQTAGVSANMRSGSNSGCGVRGWADNRDTLDYYCYTRNADFSTWTYLYNRTDGTYGWVSDSLLPGGGSNYLC
ncbi:hypothetical protein LWF15_08320 [Kineosporia rhizophila]|uniref:hypothetical protein n=1 Tax=Kineosporia TaxID=49184 RepID=UPI001E4F7172|nr:MULTISPECIES: hypothetical protein [Kineosporia]MCE0535512.1 hypothetical protein [Kineosporia rhizophila]